MKIGRSFAISTAFLLGMQIYYSGQITYHLMAAGYIGGAVVWAAPFCVLGCLAPFVVMMIWESDL